MPGSTGARLYSNLSMEEREILIPKDPTDNVKSPRFQTREFAFDEADRERMEEEG
jgi:hypothetical protein